VNEQEAEFIEAMGSYLSRVGMPRMAGRMWAYLLISDPPQQTAAQVADALHASRGSVSGSARLLASIGLIRRSTRRGERREFFEVPPGGTRELLGTAVAEYRAFVGIADRGLEAMADRAPGARARLQELRDVYAFLVAEFPALLERMDEERKGQVA
jgi:hypothetical protein